MYAPFHSISQVAAALAVLLLSSLEAGAANVNPPRLDALPTDAHSVRVDFGFGKISRVPKVLFDIKDIPADPNAAIRANAVGMHFIYPDMVPGEVSALDSKSFVQKGGRYKLDLVRFGVNVMWLYQAPRNIAGRPPGAPPIDPSPARIERNRACRDSATKCANGTGMRNMVSRVPGLLVTRSAEYLEKHPDLLIHDPARGGAYVAAPNAPYELSMNCHGYQGGHCMAFVYSRKHQFQYRALFQLEAVMQADALFRSIEKMLDAWNMP